MTRAAGDELMGEIAVVAPEPVSWLGPAVAAAARVARVAVLAPWALHPALARVAGSAPGPVAAFARRRRVPEAGRIISMPGWSLGEAGLRAWVRGRADRNLKARFWLRHAVDVWVARWLRAARPAPRLPRLIIAPSLAARRTFAEAATRSVGCFLLEDIPGIRGLHRDLDHAARAHPQCRFLRRYRAPDNTVVRQEVERALADYLIVRGTYAREQRRAAGVAEERVVALPGGEGPPASQAAADAAGARDARGFRVLLAGLAAARHGTVEALAALDSLPDVELVVRAGEGLEPPELLQHPRVRPATAAHTGALEQIDAVIAPSWCEAYASEVALAGELGVPVVATRRGAGFVEPACVIEPGDAAALARAIDHIRGTRRTGALPARPAPRSEPELERALARALASTVELGVSTSG